MRKSFFLSLMMIASLAGMGQWSSNPEMNLFVSGYQRSNSPGYWGEKVQTNAYGDTYLFFESGSLFPCISMLDRKGHAVWEPRVATLGWELSGGSWTGLVCDQEGNAITGFSSGRWNTNNHYQGNIKIQKINTRGEPLWGTGGIEFSHPDYDLVGSSMTLCNDGSILLVYQYWEDTTDQFPPSVTVRQVHRILPDGTLAWGPVGLTFRERAWTELYPLKDGTFYRIWYEQESRKSNQLYSVWINYYNSSGQPVWPKNLKIFDRQIGNWTPRASILNDHLYISWNNFNIQAINREGNELYAAGGEPVFGTRFGSFSSIIPIGKDPGGNLMFAVVFQINMLSNHRCHKLSPSGELLWGTEGRELLPVKYTGAPVHYRLDSTGNLYVFYRDLAPGAAWPEVNSRFWMDGFDTDGNRLDGFPVLIASQKRLRSPGYVSEVKNGQMIYLWEEKVPDVNLTFFAAQNVNTDGTLGNRSTGIGEAGPVSINSYIGYDFNSRVLYLHQSNEQRKIKLMSLTGSTVLELVTSGNPVLPANLQGLFILEIEGSETPPERHKIMVF